MNTVFPQHGIPKGCRTRRHPLPDQRERKGVPPGDTFPTSLAALCGLLRRSPYALWAPPPLAWRLRALWRYPTALDALDSLNALE